MKTEVVAINVTFKENYADGRGGAVSVVGPYARFSATESSFELNGGNLSAGSLFVSSGAKALISETSFVQNFASEGASFEVEGVNGAVITLTEINLSPIANNPTLLRLSNSSFSILACDDSWVDQTSVSIQHNSTLFGKCFECPEGTFGPYGGNEDQILLASPDSTLLFSNSESLNCFQSCPSISSTVDIQYSIGCFECPIQVYLFLCILCYKLVGCRGLVLEGLLVWVNMQEIYV